MAGMWPFVVALGFVSTPLLRPHLSISRGVFLCFPGRHRRRPDTADGAEPAPWQTVALYFLVANFIGMGLGPTVVASATDYVFHSDAALNKSLALCGGL
jgi:hypothetical protein